MGGHNGPAPAGAVTPRMGETDVRAIIAALAFIGLVAGATQAADMEGTGRILNSNGDWCSFVQTVEKRKVDFLKPSTGRVATIRFDDPGCMVDTAETDEGLEFTMRFNRDQIAGWIAKIVVGRWMTEDVRYDHRTRYQPGMMQKSGECIVADGMPATAIAINAVSDGTSIAKVEYASVFGCGDSL